jgi:hypothetical protein
MSKPSLKKMEWMKGKRKGRDQERELKRAAICTFLSALLVFLELKYREDKSTTFFRRAARLPQHTHERSGNVEGE